jgi:hypothetical protein
VVGEIKHFTGPEGAVLWMQTYVPQRQDAPATVSFVVSATLPETTIRTQAGKAIHELDGDLPVQNFETLNEYRDVFLKGRKPRSSASGRSGADRDRSGDDRDLRSSGQCRAPCVSPRDSNSDTLIHS